MFDRLAALAQRPDEAVADVAGAYEDDRVRVPAAVRNAALDREDPV